MLQKLEEHKNIPIEKKSIYRRLIHIGSSYHQEIVERGCNVSMERGKQTSNPNHHYLYFPNT